MGKIVRRLILDDAWDIAHNESWFSDMAQKGLHLKKYGRMFIHFERGAPKNTKYRAEIADGKPTEEQINLYRQCGWEYVADNRFIAIFAADGNTDFSELHTDPVEQSYTLEAAHKNTLANSIIMAVAVSIITLLILSTVIFSPEPVYTMVTGQFVQQLSLIAVELYLFFVVLNNHLTLCKLKKSLQSGNPIRHDLPYKAHRTAATIIALIFLILSFATILLPVGSIMNQGMFPLPESPMSLPILRLSEIEQTSGLIRQTGFDSKNFDRANSVRYEWSPLAPLQYRAEENGRVPGIKWADGSGEYSPSLHTWYYELTFSGTAKPFMYDLMHRYSYRFDRLEVNELSTPLFDEVQISKDTYSTMLFVRKQNKVMFIVYNGNSAIENALPMLADRWAV